MPNMSYVIFENTYNDLYNAHEKMDELHFNMNELSQSEREYFVKLVNLCNQISNEFLEEITHIQKVKNW
jgi:hypothetical protein